MKASVKLRDEEHKNPLLRAKFPLSALGFPLISSATAAAGDPHDLSFHLRTAHPGGPLLQLSYRPHAPSLLHSPFSLTLKSGVGLWGSPDRSPLLISAHFSLPSGGGGGDGGGRGVPIYPSFSIQIKPRIGDFSFKKTAVSSSSSSSNPNPNPLKENGGGIYHPLPLAPREPSGLEDLLLSGVAVAATTTLPMTGRAALKLRWGLNFPAETETAATALVSGNGWRRLPYLTVEKISIGAVENEEREAKKPTMVGIGDGDLEAMKGMCFWMRKEVEELQRENTRIKDSIEQVWRKILNRRCSGMEGYLDDELDVRRSNGNGLSCRGVEKERNQRRGGSR